MSSQIRQRQRSIGGTQLDNDLGKKLESLSLSDSELRTTARHLGCKEEFKSTVWRQVQELKKKWIRKQAKSITRADLKEHFFTMQLVQMLPKAEDLEDGPIHLASSSSAVTVPSGSSIAQEFYSLHKPVVEFCLRARRNAELKRSLKSVPRASSWWKDQSIVRLKSLRNEKNVRINPKNHEHVQAMGGDGMWAKFTTLVRRREGIQIYSFRNVHSERSIAFIDENEVGTIKIQHPENDDRCCFHLHYLLTSTTLSEMSVESIRNYLKLMDRDSTEVSDKSELLQIALGITGCQEWEGLIEVYQFESVKFPGRFLAFGRDGRPLIQNITRESYEAQFSILQAFK
tara:strand:- start:3657 stop:4685 length:1029 start_codon:yes stop_codon:yes gene_type:complete